MTSILATARSVFFFSSLAGLYSELVLSLSEWLVGASVDNTIAATDDKMAAAKESRLPSIVYGPRYPVPLTLTFGQLLDHHAEVRPNSPAIISHVQGCTISFKQLQERSIKLAKAMARAGVRKGSLVGIISGTRYEYVEVDLPVHDFLGRHC